MKEATAKAKDGTVKDETAKEQTFVWTDDEVELLLKVTYEFKVKKAAENVDWESVRSKYGDIWDEFKLQMPSSPDKAKETGKDFPWWWWWWWWWWWYVAVAVVVVLKGW